MAAVCRHMAVSYTHLDVYKRQDRYRQPGMAAAVHEVCEYGKIIRNAQVNLSILLLAVKGVAKFLSGKLHKAYIRFVPMSENKKS